MFDLNRIKSTIAVAVLVQFTQDDGSKLLGEFKAHFKRIEQSEIDAMIDDNTPNTEVLDRVLESVSGIGINGQELPAEEQLAWVKRTPECVGAAVAAFFQQFRPDRQNEKTSAKRRSRG